MTIPFLSNTIFYNLILVSGIKNKIVLHSIMYCGVSLLQGNMAVVLI